eukprot:2886798-Lingulodinium_polyedra.AAC.1
MLRPVGAQVPRAAGVQVARRAEQVRPEGGVGGVDGRRLSRDDEEDGDSGPPRSATGRLLLWMALLNLLDLAGPDGPEKEALVTVENTARSRSLGPTNLFFMGFVVFLHESTSH